MAKVFKSSELEKLFENDEDEKASLGHDIIDRLSTINSDAVILVDAASGREWTGAKLKDKILDVACALIDEHHFKQGSVVCISHDHSDMACILALAVVCAGGVVACSYPKDPYNELLNLARKVEPSFLFCHQRNLRWAEQLETDLGHKVIGIVMPDSFENIHLKTSGDNNIHRFEHLFNYDHITSNSRHSVPVACEDAAIEVAFITMSSGTTGLPKAVPASHKACMRDLAAFGRGPTRKGVRFACCASLDYVSGRLILLGSIKAGYTTIIINCFTPKTYLEAVTRFKIHVVYLGACSFYSLITYKYIDDYDLSSVHIIFPMGAKIVYLDELRDFFAKWPNINQIKQGYGTSELSGCAMKTMTQEEYLQDCNNCGNLLPGMEAKIIDPKTGALLGPNEKGLLLMRSNTNFLGYYDAQRLKGKSSKQLDDNANIGSKILPFINDSTVLDKDGFYITGDIAYFNDKEELFIIGREKELMSCRDALKVLPQELEEVISQHPAVSEVCVIGMPNNIQPTLQCPRAFIVPTKSTYDENIPLELTERLPRPEYDHEDVYEEEGLKYKNEGLNELCQLSTERRKALVEDIMQFVDDRIAWSKQLTGGIVLLDSLPTLKSAGKIDKGHLRRLSQIEVYGDRSG